MDKLEVNLHNLSKIEPSKGFLKASKNRLMQQIELQSQENWFMSYLRKVGIASPYDSFLAQARLRLMARITSIPQPIRIRLYGFARFAYIAKRTVASTLVMMIAVTSTLFMVEGKTVVEASDDSYLEVISGKASIKHADLLAWEDIAGQIEVRAGDLIKVSGESEAIVHFFDDSELRIGENSLFLISQLAISPSFSRQGIIEVSLHEGNAWAQTSNVEDGYAGFILTTRDSIVKTLNATFSVQTKINEPTNIFVLNNKVELTTLQPDTRQAVSTLKVAANEKARLHTTSPTSNPVVTTSKLTNEDLATAWAQHNLALDNEHLAMLRDRGISRLTQMAGTLPGQMLYPVKQAKERLKLLVYGTDSELSLQIQMANNRLSEAIVLLENGETQKGREALLAYQSIARQIAEGAGSDSLAHQLIIPYQKTMASELPNDAAIGLVKDTLHETAEILASNPVELESIRLANSVDRLRDVLNLVEMADFSAARDRLVSHQLIGGDVLTAIEGLDPEVQKDLIKEVLELRQEEVALLDTITKAMAAISKTDEQLISMLASASVQAQENVDQTLAVAAPIIPELVAKVTEGPSAQDIKVTELIDKIYIYNTFNGRKNQIERLLKADLQDTSRIDYLYLVASKLDERSAEYLYVRILQLQNKEAFQRHKEMQRKIESAQELRVSSAIVTSSPSSPTAE